jgi:hypothetical protein
MAFFWNRVILVILDWEVILRMMGQYSKWQWKSEKYRVLNEDKGRIFLTCRKIYRALDSLLQRCDT